MKHITVETWAQIGTAYASGIGLREIARNMRIPAGTVLSHAKRHGWTREIEQARAIVPPQSNAITPMQSAAITMRQRGERHVGRMAGIAERALEHVERLPGEKILAEVDGIEKLDRLGRRTFGLAESSAEIAIHGIVTQITPANRSEILRRIVEQEGLLGRRT